MRGFQFLYSLFKSPTLLEIGNVWSNKSLVNCFYAAKFWLHDGIVDYFWAKYFVW